MWTLETATSVVATSNVETKENVVDLLDLALGAARLDDAF